MVAALTEHKVTDPRFELEHPRDRKGRFIETGAEVRILGGALARVLANVGGGRFEVVRNADGQHRIIHRNYLTVVARPDGSKPVGGSGRFTAPMPVTAPSSPNVPDVTPANTSVQSQHLTPAHQVADHLENAGQYDLADQVRLDASKLQRALRDPSVDPGREADTRAALLTTLDQAAQVAPDAPVADAVTAATAEHGDLAEPTAPSTGDLFTAALANADPARRPVLLAAQGLWDGGFGGPARAALASLNDPAYQDLLDALDRSNGGYDTSGGTNGQVGDAGGTPLPAADAGRVRADQRQADVLQQPGDGSVGADRPVGGLPSGGGTGGGDVRADSGPAVVGPAGSGVPGDTGVDLARPEPQPGGPDTGTGPERPGPDVGAGGVPGGGSGGDGAAPADQPTQGPDTGVTQYNPGDRVVFHDPESFIGPRIVTFSHYADDPSRVYIDLPPRDITSRRGPDRVSQRQQVPIEQITPVTEVPVADIQPGDRIIHTLNGRTQVSTVADTLRDPAGILDAITTTEPDPNTGGPLTLPYRPGSTVNRLGTPAAPTPAADTADEAITAADQPEPIAAGQVNTIPPAAQAFQPTGIDDLSPAGKVGKLNGNMAALRLLRQLQTEQRPATPDEQAVLAKWAGWGGIPEVFDPNRPEYAKQRDELRGTNGQPGLLSDAQWREARRDTLNAHYTDARAVQDIWTAVEKLGFDGGEVLEPGSGSGTFIGFAPDNAHMTGVELDSTTAAISKYLYPQATIRNESFARTNIPDGHFDATIGNVPFGQFALTDPEHNPTGESIHNHFILKSLDLTRPGGLVAVLTSRYTLDSQNAQARTLMAQKADLVGAVRLPTGSHQRASGTDVIEDLLIFRKRPEGVEPQTDQSWVHSTKRNLDGWQIQVNDYWQTHQQNVLGTMKGVRGQFGGDMQVAGSKDFSDLPAALDRIVADAKRDGLLATPNPGGTEATPKVLADPSRHEGHMQAEADGTFTQAVGGASVPVDVPAKHADEVKALISIRDNLSALLTAESGTADDTPELAAMRDQLNKAYDGYVAKYGPVNRYSLTASGARRRPPAQLAFRADPMSAVVRALETYDPSTDPPTAKKASIFRSRAVAPRAPITTADNPADALTVSIDTYGEVNLPAIARLLGVDEQEARQRLTGLVYEDPPLSAEEQDAAHQIARQSALDANPDADVPTVPTIVDSVRQPGRLVPTAEYLSGNVRKKLAVARAAAAADPRFAENVAALEPVIPRDLGPDEIDGRLGASWIDAETVSDFLHDLLNQQRYKNNPYSPIKVIHGGGSTWTVTTPKWGNLATETWGTEARNTGELVQSMLEQRPIRVTNTIDGKSVPNLQATLEAQAKAEQIQERFAEWLWEDADRARRLQQAYNDQFNGITLRSYTGSTRQFPGMSDEWKNKVHGHVVNAVERIVSEPTTLLAHVVGAGKTAEMVMGSQELRRLGLARKPAIVVPNHMLEQFSREYLEIYPGAKLLAAGTEDLQNEKRREFVARAATGDWDAVILTQTAFESIPMSPEQIEAYIQREIGGMRDQLDNLEANGDGGRDVQRTVKKMEKALIRAEEALRKKLQKSKDVGVSFEQTGIDYLFVDEAHGYSNLRTLSNIQGAGNIGSDRATDLHMKMEFLRENNASGRVATFATGTPIRNTVTQAYTMIKYLRPDLLEAAGITDFDQWAATFGSTVDEMELKPEGNGFRQTTRFAKFRNVPELLRIFHTFADVKMAEDLNLPTPTLAGGQVETVAVPRTDQLAEYITALGERADEVRAGAVDPSVDNMLKISTDGRKAALSMELVGGTHEPGKIETAADNIAQIWESNRDTIYSDPQTGEPDPVPGGLQIVFLDMGTPKTAKDRAKTGVSVDDVGDWNGYDKLKAELVARGMPADKIRYIHEAKNDAQKAEMFAAARSGQISVLIGSSEKMGVGTNMQKRAVALHHLDAPWRPADVEQRDGRIMRQGNLNPEVRILRYVTEGSFDAYMWQTLERKAKFINQVMRGTLDVREIEDVGDTAMSYAEVKAIATGNPDLLDKAKIDTLLAKLERLERGFRRTQSNLRTDSERLTLNAAQWQANAAAFDAAIQQRTDISGDNFTATIGGQAYTDRTDAGKALTAALDGVMERDRFGDNPPRPVATIGGHTLTAQVRRAPGGGRSTILAFDGVPGEVSAIPQSTLISARESEAAARGVLSRVENGLALFDDKRDRNLVSADRARTEVAQMQARFGGTFPRQAELDAARAKAARLDEKIKRDAQRAKGVDVPFDPMIDTDQFDDPILNGPKPQAEQAPIEVTEAPDGTATVVDPSGQPTGDEVAAANLQQALAEVSRETVTPAALTEGDRIEFVPREISGGVEVGTVTRVRETANFVFVTILGDDGKTYTRAIAPTTEVVRVTGDQQPTEVVAAKAKKPPQIATGSFVSWSGGQGRVDMVVTSGKVPGVDDDVEGTPGSPAARVVVWESDGGGHKPSRRKVGAKVATLKRIPPLQRGGKKDAAATLMELLAAHERKVAAGSIPTHAAVTGVAVKEVFDRGVESWPGAARTTLTAQEWAVGRVEAFLNVAAGVKVKHYRRDADLLPVGHPDRAQPETKTVTVDAADLEAALHSLQM